jgi:hypothetical protein
MVKVFEQSIPVNGLRFIFGLPVIISMTEQEGKEKIVSALEGLTRIAELKTDVGTVLVTEYGARILGVFLKNKRNPLWVAEDPRDVINGRDWNLGGNRLWLSPERNYYYRRPEDFEEWLCQPSLDPGNWRIVSSREDIVTLEEETEVEDFANHTRIPLSLSRTFFIYSSIIQRGVEHVGLRIREALIAKGEIRSGINLWSLTQIRPGRGGGTVLIPTRRGAKPIHYFGRIPKDRLRVSENHVSFRIDGAAVHKLGIAPEDNPQLGCSTIMYYMENGGGEAFLLSMRTMMAPRSQEECLDVAKADPSGPKGCIQSYNSGPELGFGEMELHFKPAVRIKDYWISYADYDIDVFAGSRKKVLGILRRKVPKPFLF